MMPALIDEIAQLCASTGWIDSYRREMVRRATARNERLTIYGLTENSDLFRPPEWGSS